ncbi:hypothetical protein J4205_03485 [Candidatus Pacearchaeota archaeon]|nr:hypothetical protein [Candidatus Pacearchaeota archaeon]
MKMRKRGLLIAFIMLFFMVSLVSADVFLIQQPKDVYNYGDNLEVLLGSDGGEGWVSIDLVCSQGFKTLYFQYLYGETEIPITLPLTSKFLKDLTGECYLSITFEDLVKKSSTFLITNRINVDVKFNRVDFFTNENITFTGVASKANKQPVTGAAKITISQIGLESIVPVENGKFSGYIIFPENTKAGDYNMDVFVYESKSDQITNFDNKTFSLSVLQMPTSLEINSPDNVNPSSEIDISSVLYDQAHDSMDGFSVALNVFDVNNQNIKNILLKTGEQVKLIIPKNAPYGYWNITAESEKIKTNKVFHVKENKEAEFVISNNTLIIRNIGNVPYDKFIKISIGNTTKIQPLNISTASSLLLELSAPDGVYDVEVNDGDVKSNARVALTGNVIDVRSPYEGSGVLGVINKGFFAWIFVFMILGLFIFISIKKVAKRKSVLFFDGSLPKKKEGDKGGVVKLSSSDSIGKSSGGKTRIEHVSSEALPSLVLDGEKQDSSVISLKVKNYEQIKSGKSNAHGAIEEAIKEITSNHGRIYRKEDSIVGIFAPVITKKFDNEVNAVKVAQKISNLLNEHNKRYTQKVDFGIGVNNCNIIASKDKGKLLFTPVNNSISGVRTISELANNDLLLGEAIHKKLGAKVKTSPHSHGGVKTYAVLDVIERKDNDKFIKGFLDRNKEYKDDKPRFKQ